MASDSTKVFRTMPPQSCHQLLASSLERAQLSDKGFVGVGKGPGPRAGDQVEWLTISNQRQAVTDDVQKSRSRTLVPKSISIYGLVYDVNSGKRIEVTQFNKAGAVI